MHDWASVVVAGIQYLSWPVVTYKVFSTLLNKYSEEIRGVLNNIESFSGAGLQVKIGRKVERLKDEFGEDIQAKAMEFAKVQPFGTINASDKLELGDAAKTLTEIVPYSPSAAIMKSWDIVENKLDKILNVRQIQSVYDNGINSGGIVPGSQIFPLKITLLSQQHKIDENLRKKLLALLSVRNVVSHSYGKAEASTEQAYYCIAASTEILNELQKIADGKSTETD